MFQGGSKPKDIGAFLQCFVTDLTSCILSGVENLSVRVQNYIMDTPARSSILNFKNAGGYNCCIECEIQGEYSAKLRTMQYLGILNNLF